LGDGDLQALILALIRYTQKIMYAASDDAHGTGGQEDTDGRARLTKVASESTDDGNGRRNQQHGYEA
jgi:hypothetical protein